MSERYKEDQDYLKSAEPKKKRDSIVQKQINPSIKLIDFVSEDSMHSDSWVIHGNFTETGKPMLANDPHLGTSIPSFW